MTEINADSSWKKSKNKLKQKFADLTKNDQVLAGRKKNEVIARLQLRLGTTEEETLKIISRLF
ncbi:hypothetical protein [Sunxiuqinia sp. sy24]|uniref:hypothetical protein n=1 Tax=Sunxiuqinia sp. sy24 TaxID=3461495 RepID=UPI004045EBD6